jgi:hypothetical protein
MKILSRIGIMIFAVKILSGGQHTEDLSKMFPKQISGGNEDIPAMMSAANFVCKGEVISAPEPTFSRKETPRMTATAFVRMDRCFKGDLTGKTVGVQIDNVLEAAGGSWHPFLLHPGEYDLIFLKPWNDRYITVNQFYGALPVSRKSGANIEDPDPLMRLELDLRKVSLPKSQSE